MSKYIDADTLLNNLPDDLPYKASVKRVLIQAPTADVAEEIFGEIDKIIDKHYNNHIFGNNDLDDLEHDAIINFSDDVTYDIAELKKKYLGEDNNVPANTEE